VRDGPGELKQNKFGREEMETRMEYQNINYDRARTAYEQQDYELAAEVINELVRLSPDDPDSRLLRGHIYYMLQQYSVAKSEYQSVLHLTDDQEIIGFVNNCLATIDQYIQPFDDYESAYDHQVENEASLNSGTTGNFNSSGSEINSFAEYKPSLDSQEDNPFASHPDSFHGNFLDDEMSDDPFSLPTANLTGELISGQLPPFCPEEIAPSYNHSDINNNVGEVGSVRSDSYSTIGDTKLSLDKHEPISSPSISRSSIKINNSPPPQRQRKDDFEDDDFDLDEFESAFGAEDEVNLETDPAEDTSKISHVDSNNNYIGFLNNFDEFDDLPDTPGFEPTEDERWKSGSLNSRGSSIYEIDNSFDDENIEAYEDHNHSDPELFTITGPGTGAKEPAPVFTKSEVAKVKSNIAVEQGLFARFKNASLDEKQWWIAGTVGLVSMVGIASATALALSMSPTKQQESVRNTGLLMALVAGATGAATAGLMGNLTLTQIRRTTKDLQNQFDLVNQGNLNVEATVYSQDELGDLATSFNDMTRVIFTTTNETQRKAMEMEEAQENLQRQVIRLLDDVEGAARGDLTVQAEVTADVLGAVADAFNLTIQNLRDIVQQVKVAARDVTKGSTNSETFARALSGDALRQAEKLAVTLNSVQIMTASIQRVAEAAREAEAVARDASKIAQKGGEAVENTVAGILEIRETVAETSRKVKRLAESSQEINSIIAIVSQIASRTNLLALNASIEAARAGEAGRGFAIVADEVRQLADRSAKSLREIEQIVMQIQSETSSVMTAMEEGTQQVIHQTKLAEEAKRSLDNIIQVADHIDLLVRSITSDTMEQTETSRAVAQVMQSVELAAQETSQEAQRVSGALQHLVGVSRDLISSVERFRVDAIESR
jgi:twitching motility protein PilJ